jgi:hypothetical protein
MTRPLLIVPTADAYFFAICANPNQYALFLEEALVSRQAIDHATQMLSNLANNEDEQRKKLESVLRVGFEVKTNNSEKS